MREDDMTAIRLEIAQQNAVLEEKLENHIDSKLTILTNIVQNNQENIRDINELQRITSNKIAHIDAEINSIQEQKSRMYEKMEATEDGIDKLNSNPIFVIATMLTVPTWVRLFIVGFLFLAGTSVVDLFITNRTQLEQKLLKQQLETLDKKIERLDKITDKLTGLE